MAAQTPSSARLQHGNRKLSSKAPLFCSQPLFSPGSPSFLLAAPCLPPMFSDPHRSSHRPVSASTGMGSVAGRSGTGSSLRPLHRQGGSRAAAVPTSPSPPWKQPCHPGRALYGDTTARDALANVFTCTPSLPLHVSSAGMGCAQRSGCKPGGEKKHQQSQRRRFPQQCLFFCNSNTG